MSELIQESKYITVQEFIPKWTDLIESGKFDNYGSHEGQGELRLTSSNTCLVGEAHGLKPWKNNYTDSRGTNFCGHCKGIALGCRSINGVNFSEATYSLKELYKFKEGLYDHFMEAHPEKLLRK